MMANGEIFDLLTSSYKEQQEAYGSIDEMFGSTGEIPNIIDRTMANLERSIMLGLGWELKRTNIAPDLTCNNWVKGEMIINEDIISEWFSIFTLFASFEDRMNILYKMSIGDADAYEMFNVMLAENE